MFIYVIYYVLAILCGTVVSLKIHRPGGPQGQVEVNKPVNVSWSHPKPNDPNSVLMFMENLGDATRTFLRPLDTHLPGANVPMTFSSVGTFRLLAVNPSNPSDIYDTSKNFTVVATTTTASNVTQEDNGTSSPSPPNGSAVPNPSPDSTSSSVTLSATGTPSSSSREYILAGAISGGVVLLLLLTALTFVLCRRRKARIERRTTFHRTRMVRSLPPPTFAVPRDVELDSPSDDAVPGARYLRDTQYMREVPLPAPVAYPFARTA
ncbi:hypothetical protein FB451DRAFT_1282890 [Mycena latifolia]|nr:hypothetical protein FB451DRAFT_1282890 [Mycena latifolia]